MMTPLTDVFNIVKVIGEGGNGKVLLGVRKSNGLNRALKLMDEILFNTRSEHIIKKVAVGSTCHPAVICYHDVRKYEYEGKEYMVIEMDWIEGQTFYDLFKDLMRDKARLSERSAMQYYTYLLTGLIYLHDHDVAHRDIKYDNVMIKKEGGAILIDLDHACDVRSLNPVYGCTKDETRIGAHGFRPPSPSRDIDPFKWDVYCLALVIAQVLTVVPYTQEYVNMTEKVRNMHEEVKALYNRANNDHSLHAEYLKLHAEYTKLSNELQNNNENHNRIKDTLMLLPINYRFKEILIKALSIREQDRPTARQIYNVMRTLV